MRTLIIPDIHTKFGLAESIIEKEQPNEVVFLGDYFDDFDIGIEVAHQTAEWLKESMKKPERIHLIGNHDLAYADPGRHACSGYTSLKKYAIDKVGIVWDQLWRWVWVDDWLCTHAGLSNEFYKEYAKKGEDVNNFLLRMYEDKETEETLYSVSEYRKGHDKYSGILWCDWREFEPIDGVKQMFGHTVGDVVRGEVDNDQHGTKFGYNNLCIDTALQHYAVYDHHERNMTVKSTMDMPDNAK